MDEITDSPVKSPMEAGEAFGDTETDYSSIRGKVIARLIFVYQHIVPAKNTRPRSLLSLNFRDLAHYYSISKKSNLYLMSTDQSLQFHSIFSLSLKCPSNFLSLS